MKRFRFSLLLVCVLLPVSGNGGTASLPSLKVLLLSGSTTPTNGTNEIQTITFGSGQVSGNFYLRFNNRTTAAIPWSSTNATLVANIDSALEALGNIGAAGVGTAVGSMTAGVGTINIAFNGNNSKNDVPQMTVPSKTTSGTIAVTTTTPGVVADGRNAPAGTLLMAYSDSGDYAVYVNVGTPPSPSWQATLLTNQ
jgi:hypothetical protein